MSGIAFVRLLGPIQVVTSAEKTLDLPSVTQRRLLAILALEARRPIRSERLAEDLAMSPGSLRTSVSRLRKLLGAELLQTDPVGYRLEVDVDSELFSEALRKVDGADRLPGPRGEDRGRQRGDAAIDDAGAKIERPIHEDNGAAGRATSGFCGDCVSRAARRIALRAVLPQAREFGGAGSADAQPFCAV